MLSERMTGEEDILVQPLIGDTEMRLAGRFTVYSAILTFPQVAIARCAKLYICKIVVTPAQILHRLGVKQEAQQVELSLARCGIW